VAGTGTAKDVGSATTDASGNFTVTLTDQPAQTIFAQTTIVVNPS
jgi:hypothetical protein